MGWILATSTRRREHEAIRDFAKFPELVWLDRNQFLAPMLYGLGLWLAFSWTGLFWGFFLSTVLLWHGTFAINSVTHVFGKRVFETRDTSRNSFLMALVTMGEGWHNNHHHFQASAAQGFLWWQVDPSLYLIRLGRLLGIAKDLRPVPEKIAGLARERAVWHFSSRTFERAREAFDGAQAAWDARAEQLSAGWAERRETALASASHRLAELEASRLRAAAQLERLKADYAAALAAAAAGTRLRGQRARALAEIRVEELRAEIERTRRSLVEALERLVEAAGGARGSPRRPDPALPPRAVPAGPPSTPRFANIRAHEERPRGPLPRPRRRAPADDGASPRRDRLRPAPPPLRRPATPTSPTTTTPRSTRRPTSRTGRRSRGRGTSWRSAPGRSRGSCGSSRATTGTSRRSRHPTSSRP